MTSLKFKLTLAYDGANYAGWQAQRSGMGVQEVIETALRKLFPGVRRLHSSSRTDAGVHALGMVAHVEIAKGEFKMTVPKLLLALNAYLPPEIRVMKVTRAPAAFHARFDATGKQYRYFVWNHRAHHPLWRHQAWHVPQPLALTAMRQAARLLVGRHDFKSFAGTRSYEMESTVRTLTCCELRRSGALLTFIIEGDGFLYKMCRAMVGTLVQIGQGKFSPAEIGRMLAGKDRRHSGMTAPAHGLVLWKVFYAGKRA